MNIKLTLTVDKLTYEVIGNDNIERVLNEMQSQKFIKIFDKSYSKTEFIYNPETREQNKFIKTIDKFIYLPVDKIELAVLEKLANKHI
ncbi:hypothetical protein [Enterococcus faecium]|uniref:hypothetical protein n=1 Tax=Enterococcus faecium TaxID=1352 RepID=UPI000352D3F6|nr:hypothetical protein [Enterococcus faecium]EPI26562.1 hypothetical protein D352_00004 [Enterococcus faecium LA4B-2]